MIFAVFMTGIILGLLRQRSRVTTCIMFLMTGMVIQVPTK